MRNDERLLGQTNDLFKTFRIDVGGINNNAEFLAFADDFLTELGQPITRWAARCENAATAGGIATGVSQSDRANA